MNRMLSSLLGLALVASVATSATSAKAQEEETYEWRMATLAPETSTYFQLFAVKFAHYAELLTDGRVKITPFPAGVLAPAFEVYQAVQDGIADVGNSWPGYLVRQDATNSLLSAHPGGMGTDAYLTWLYQGGGQELWQEFRRDTMGLHALVVGAGPTEVHMHANKPVRTIEDLEGMRFRTSGASADVAATLGAATVTTSVAEIYPMLERGAVDAAEWSTPAENMVAGLHEVVPYIVLPGIHQPVFAFDFVIRTEVWDALPDDIKAKLETAAKITTFESYHEWTMRDLEAMEQLKEAGAEIVWLEPSYIEAYTKAGREWADEHLEGNVWMERVSESYFGFLERWEENAFMHLNQQR